MHIRKKGYHSCFTLKCLVLLTWKGDRGGYMGTSLLSLILCNKGKGDHSCFTLKCLDFDQNKFVFLYEIKDIRKE